MPKKTKKQKILARERRSIQPIKLQSHLDLTQTKTFYTPNYELNNLDYKAPISYNLVDASQLQVIRLDLIKTMVFAMIAIATEIIFSYFIR